jgi:hypothetical protein
MRSDQPRNNQLDGPDAYKNVATPQNFN